nr:MAG TPA: endonuclease [Caudoviricetes sp.]
MKKYNHYKFLEDCVLVYPQDRDDIYTILDYKWYEYFKEQQIYLYPKKDRNNGYYWCYRKGKKTTIRVHSVICCLHCDHKNGNKSDNREENLRPATPSQNRMNTPIRRGNKTGYKGVQYGYNENTYCVQLRFHGKLYYFGEFESIQEAAKVYDKAALKYFGEFAWTNFDKCSYNAEEIESIQPKTIKNKKFNGPNKNNKLGLKGVNEFKGKYQATLYSENKKRIRLGTFNTPEEAARAYDKVALKEFNNECFTNFPKEEYI